MVFPILSVFSSIGNFRIIRIFSISKFLLLKTFNFSESSSDELSVFPNSYTHGGVTCVDPPPDGLFRFVLILFNSVILIHYP